MLQATKRRRNILRDSIVAECEWKSFEYIVEDFEKLLLARASVRLMIFDGNYKPGSKGIAARLAKRIREFKGTRYEDAWLLAAFEGLDDGRWRFRYFPVEGSTSLINLSNAENPDFFTLDQGRRFDPLRVFRSGAHQGRAGAEVCSNACATLRRSLTSRPKSP